MSAIALFPHRYTVSFANGALGAGPRPRIPAGAPPQFGGSDRVWSPEELLVGSVLLCLKTTFDAYARREALEVLDWRGTGVGVLEKTGSGPAFTSMRLTVQIKAAPGSEERVRFILAEAQRNCIISHALKAPVHVDAEITALPVQPTA